jgi:general secretion pathway protein D
VDGWRLTRIAADRVELVSGRESVDLLLREPRQAASTRGEETVADSLRGRRSPAPGSWLMRTMIRNAALLVVAGAILGCAGSGVAPAPAPAAATTSPAPAPAPPTSFPEEPAPPAAAESPPAVQAAEEYLGSGGFINPAAATGSAKQQGEGLVLNFEGTDLKEVVKTVLGDMLGVAYSIDATITGTVTLQTSRPIPREAVIPTLETLLRASGAALVKSGDMYLVVPESKVRIAGSAPTLRPRSDEGFQYVIVPLQYLAAAEMEKILTPILPGKTSLEVDAKRNILILAGSGADLESLLQTVRIFDVDQMAGMSVGLYRCRRWMRRRSTTSCRRYSAISRRAPWQAWCA